MLSSLIYLQWEDVHGVPESAHHSIAPRVSLAHRGGVTYTWAYFSTLESFPYSHAICICS